MSTEPDAFNPRMEELVQNVYAFRSEFMRQFGSRRQDIYGECGYEPVGTLPADLYYGIYRREPVAKRAVTLMPLECWKVQPEIVESDDSDRDTPFEKGVDELAKSLRGSQSWYGGSIGNPINEYLKRLHMMAGIGRFGCLLYGFDDGLPLDQPVKGILTNVSRCENRLQPGEADKLRSLKKLTKNEAKSIARMSVSLSARDSARRDQIDRQRQAELGTDAQYFDYSEWGERLADKPSGEGIKLLFCRVYSEHLTQIVRWESDPTSPRFGQPLLYRITLNDPREQHTGIGLPLATVFVHWSRILHLPLNLESSEVLGVPTLEAILNPVYDVMKIRAGSAEMYWRGAFPGLSFETHPELGGDVPIDREKLRKEYQDYIRGLERAMVTSGLIVKTLSPTITAPTEWLKVQMEAICIQLRCPMRVFLGSERGELASSQDDSQWNDQVREVENSVCTPHIIIPFYDRLIQVGALPTPKDYKAVWPDLESLGDMAKAQVAVQKVTALTTYTQGGGNQVLPEKNLLTDMLGYKSDEADAILKDRDKDQQDELKDAQGTADEHGFVPTPPPGFQHPPPPPMPPGAKGATPPMPKPSAPPKIGANAYTEAAELAAKLSGATQLQPSVLLIANRALATNQGLSFVERKVLAQLNSHTAAHNAHVEARALCLNVDRIAEHKALEEWHADRMEELGALAHNWKQPDECPECGAKMDGKKCGQGCGFSWRGASKPTTNEGWVTLEGGQHVLIGADGKMQFGGKAVSGGKVAVPKAWAPGKKARLADFLSPSHPSYSSHKNVPVATLLPGQGKDARPAKERPGVAKAVQDAVAQHVPKGVVDSVKAWIGSLNLGHFSLPSQKEINKSLVRNLAGTPAAAEKYSFAQKLAERVSRQRGATPEKAERLKVVLSTVDAVAGKPLRMVSKSAGSLPLASAAYLAWSTVRSPIKVLKAAVGLMVDHVKTAATKTAVGAAAKVLHLNSADSVAELLADAPIHDDWYFALLMAAMQHIDSVEDAVSMADAVHKKQPTANVNDQHDAKGQFASKQAGFDVPDGVKLVKKNPDPMFGGYHVTLDNGDVHQIYKDVQSGVWRHANPKGTGHFDDIVSTGKKDEALHDLLKSIHRFTANSFDESQHPRDHGKFTSGGEHEHEHADLSTRGWAGYLKEHDKNNPQQESESALGKLTAKASAMVAKAFSIASVPLNMASAPVKSAIGAIGKKAFNALPETGIVSQRSVVAVQHGAHAVETWLEGFHKAGQEAAIKVAKGWGMNDSQVARVGRVLGTADGLLRWTANVPAAHSGIELAAEGAIHAMGCIGGPVAFLGAKAGFYTPVASLAFVAAAGAPLLAMKAIRHAREAVRAVMPRRPQLATNAAFDPADALAKAIVGRSDDFDAYLHAALDEAHGDLATAIKYAEEAYGN